MTWPRRFDIQMGVRRDGAACSCIHPDVQLPPTSPPLASPPRPACVAARCRLAIMDPGFRVARAGVGHGTYLTTGCRCAGTRPCLGARATHCELSPDAMTPCARGCSRVTAGPPRTAPRATCLQLQSTPPSTHHNPHPVSSSVSPHAAARLDRAPRTPLSPCAEVLSRTVYTPRH